MADVRPFRGIRYDFDTLPERAAADLVAPPYDVIDDDEQAALYERHPNNVVRLILGRQHDSDTDENNRYTRARRHMIDWLAQGVLRVEDDPALYLHEQIFSDEAGVTHTRRGFLGRVRLHTYDEQVILPHERTLRGPKIDRLKLMKACECNLSPVFLLYDDPEREVDQILEARRGADALLDLKTEHDGITHRMWNVVDPDAHQKVSELLSDKQLLIADGHHRYETALAYRDFRRRVAEEWVAEEWVAEERMSEGGAAADAPFNFALAFMVNIHDPGLQVFATHRLVHGVSGFDYRGFLAGLDASRYFEIAELDAGLVDKPLELSERLSDSGASAPSFVVLGSEDDAPVLVRYTGDVEADVFDADTPTSVRKLDVAILHEGILDRMLGISKEAQEAKTNLRYVKSFEAAVDSRTDDDVQLTILMNPTPVAQVAQVCQSGGKMPQKSTFFYPKILSGLTLNPL